MPAERLAARGALLARPSDLELGKHPEHLKQRLSRWGTGIDALPIEVEIDPGAVHLAEEAHEILERAAQPIYRAPKGRLGGRGRDLAGPL